MIRSDSYQKNPPLFKKDVPEDPNVHFLGFSLRSLVGTLAIVLIILFILIYGR